MELTALERAAVDKLLEGQHPALAQLQLQLHALRATSRELTGVGFYTKFEPLPEAIRVGSLPEHLRISDVDASINGVENGAGFLLYVDGGYITMLEGFSYGDEWPADITSFSLRHREPRRQEVLDAIAQIPSTSAAPRAIARLRVNPQDRKPDGG